MPEVASIFSGSQIGVETTSGTAVSASKLMRYMGWSPSMPITFNEFRPMGQVVASTITPGMDFTEWAIDGRGSYGEMMVPLLSVLVSTTPATVETTARRWTFTPAVGRGHDQDLHRRVRVRDKGAEGDLRVRKRIEVTFNREEGVSVTGSAVGQQIQDNITLTTSPTGYGDKPILPTHLDVYVDTTSGSFGSTQLTRDFNAVWRVNNRWGAVWPINSANASFAAHVNLEPTVEIELNCCG